MAKILVMGSLEFDDPKHEQFLAFLGEEIVSQGHKLLNGCRSVLDAKIAESAFNYLQEEKLDIDSHLLSYIEPDSKPAHNFGTILKSRCTHWSSLATPGLEIPETIREADVVIIIGGKDGTNCAANWARIGRKPLMPITVFGGSASDIFDTELEDFDERYGDNIQKSDYEILNQFSTDLDKIVKDSVSLVMRTLTSNKVFVVMSFSDDPALIDVYDSYQEVCGEFGFEAEKIDNSNAVDRIVKEIFERIKRSAFVIVDLSEPKPNVYYELGLAQGMSKPVIISAKKSKAALPFDVADIPTIFWENQKRLKENLRERINLIAPAHGRRQH